MANGASDELFMALMMDGLVWRPLFTSLAWLTSQKIIRLAHRLDPHTPLRHRPTGHTCPPSPLVICSVSLLQGPALVIHGVQ